MSTSIDYDTAAAPAEAAYGSTRRGRWIDDWEPENSAFWEATGQTIARKNLIFSIFAENLGFSIWVLWTIIVINLAQIGIVLSVPEAFWLTAVPNLIGSALRIPYTFAVPRFGGRVWTMISASLLLIPCLLVAIVVPSGWLADQSHDTQFWVLLACAATAGFGGGNFSSSMANISFFYPEKRKGFALGLNAAGGNLGVAMTQLLVPLVIIVGVPAAAVKLPAHEVHLAYAGLMWMPLIVVAAICAFFYMDSLTQAKSDGKAYGMAVKQSQTWIMSILYIGTFGSFIGYSFALPLVIKNTFPEFLGQHVFIATYLAGLGFVGALIGSVARPFGGWVSDRAGGARVTLACFAGMGAFTLLAIAGVNSHSFWLFFGSYMVIFFFAGMGNGSTYRMIPSIFAALGKKDASEKGVDPEDNALTFKRQAAAVIGIAGAVGAVGGVLIQVLIPPAPPRPSALMTQATKAGNAAIAAAQKTGDAAQVAAAKADLAHTKAQIAAAHQDWSIPALWVFFGAYFVFGAMTWFFYMRRSFATDKVPSLAYAAV
jgi:NNP family nitrate/nitrite transporter-like MFS transporter